MSFGTNVPDGPDFSRAKGAFTSAERRHYRELAAQQKERVTKNIRILLGCMYAGDVPIEEVRRVNAAMRAIEKTMIPPPSENTRKKGVTK